MKSTAYTLFQRASREHGWCPLNQLGLIPARRGTATGSAVAFPSSPCCLHGLRASLLPCLSQITLVSAPPHPCALHVCSCFVYLVPSLHSLLQPLLSSHTSDTVVPCGRGFHRIFLHFRSSQNFDKTQMVRSTAASDGASGRTPTHQGRSQQGRGPGRHTRRWVVGQGDERGCSSVPGAGWHCAVFMLGGPRALVFWKGCQGCLVPLLLGASPLDLLHMSLLFALQSQRTRMTYSSAYLVTAC